MKLSKEFLESIAKFQKQNEEELSRILVGFAKIITHYQELMKDVVMAVAELGAQFSTAIIEGVNNFDPPQTYDPDTITVRPDTREVALRDGVYMLDDMKGKHFEYLYDRHEAGLNAYFAKDYQKAIFLFISCLDGILKEFCVQHRGIDSNYYGDYPSHQNTYDHLMNHYNFSILMEDGDFKQRLEAFFDHRHEIMHGGRHAYFDENIAIIALLFLGLVYYSVIDEI